MGERDWLTELTSALGDEPAGSAAPVATAEDVLPSEPDPASAPDIGDRGLTIVPDPDVPPPAPPAAPPPPIDEELDLMGPGRSLEGWAEELASAFAEDDEPEPDDEPPAAELRPATEPAAVLRFDSLAAERATAAPAVDDVAVNAAVEIAVAVAAADIAAGLAVQGVANGERLTATEARLERIEALLTADLAQLGPAVLADSVGDIEARLAELHAAVGAVTERIEALPVPDPEALAALAGGPDAEGADLAGSLGELRALVDRLTDRVAAQARFLAAHADTTAADAHQRDDLLRAILARLEAG
jgi:hypothetical protein